MPKKIDPAVKERALRMVSEHRGEYSSLTACCDQVGPPEDVAQWPLSEKTPRHHQRRQTDRTTPKCASSTECFPLEEPDPWARTSFR